MSAAAANRAVAAAYRAHWGRVLAVLIKAFRDIDLCEDALQEAFAAAATHWRAQVPGNPSGWLYVTARRKALDRLRRRAAAERGRQPLEAADAVEVEADESAVVPDERLGLMLLCCHPALAPEAQVALTLRAVGGLTTPEIARLFLIKDTAMAARLTRAKHKILEARIPFREPGVEEWPERLDGAMATIYLVFTQGYAPAVSERLLREELCGRAIGLAEVLVGLSPGEVRARGLLALMLIQHARRDARTDADGTLVRLSQQDRALWHGDEIARGLALVAGIEPVAADAYGLQALIAAEHVNKPSAAETDWARIAWLYGFLEARNASPVVTLNRAVAVMEAEGPAAGLAMLERVGEALVGHAGWHVARAEMLLRLGDREGARAGFARAAALSGNAVERAFLEGRVTGI